MQRLLNNKIHTYLVTAIAFCLPVYSNIIPPLIVLCILFWLSKPNEIIEGCRSLIKNKAVSAMVALFLIYAIGVLYSANTKEGLQILETKLSLILLPIVFSTQIKNHKENLNQYLRFFIYGCILSALICFGWALYSYLKPVYVLIEGKEYDLGASYFYYGRLSVFIHPSYISMYSNFSLLALYYLVNSGEIKMNWKWIFAALLISVFVLLLSSKAGWIGLFIVALFVMINLIRRKFMLPAIAILVSLCSLFYVLIISAPEYSQRITAATESVSQSASGVDLKNSKDGTASRILVWQAAIDIIKEKFLIGTGTGDAKTAMVEKYKEKGMITEFEHNLNAHDQYLNTFVALGVLGFVSLMLCLVIPLFYAVKHKLTLLGTFVCLVGLSFLFESMLETQSGVMFYAFFQTLLCFSFFNSSTPNGSTINN